MAKTRHQKLAREMQLLAQKTCKKKMTLQLERPQIRLENHKDVTSNIVTSLKPLKTLIKAYHYAFFYFKPNPTNFEIMRLMCRGAIVEIPGAKKLDKPPIAPIRIFVNWIALANYLEQDSTRSLNDFRLDLWSLPFEANSIKKLKEESLQNSLFYQTQTIARYERHKPLIKAEFAKQKKQIDQNLLKDALSIWNDSKKLFLEPLSEKSDPDIVAEVARNPRNLDSISFAPTEGETIHIAYEKVMNSIHNRQDQHRFVLRKIYKEALEKAIFNNVRDDKLFKKLPFLTLKTILPIKSSKQKVAKQGRWQSSQVIDYWTMNSLFNYFYSTFILDPTNLKAGDIAIIILLRVWIATLDKGEHVSMNDILHITSLDVNFQERTLKIGEKIFHIPRWIFLLLSCYFSKKNQIRAHRLFKSLDIHGKSLERAFHEASKIISGSETVPILPESLMYLPHGYIECRFPIAELKAMRKVEPLIAP